MRSPILESFFMRDQQRDHRWKNKRRKDSSHSSESNFIRKSRTLEEMAAFSFVLILICILLAHCLSLESDKVVVDKEGMVNAQRLQNDPVYNHFTKEVLK